MTAQRTPPAEGDRRRRGACAAMAGIGLSAMGAAAARAQPAATASTASTASTDWTESAPGAEGLDADAVASTLKDADGLPFLRALLAARHGRLVAERYYGGAGPADLQAINSCTKSVSGLLVALALHDGHLLGPDQTVAQLLPDAAAQWPDSPAGAVTLRQIITGRSGLALDPAAFAELMAAPDLVRFAMTRPPLAATPGGWTYNDALVSLLSPIIARAGPGDMADIASRRLFAPLGIERFEWQRDRQRRPLAAAGLSLRPRDLLKLAQLMLAGGRWRGQAVLPAEAVADSLAPQGPASWRVEPVTDIGYGRLWFTGRLHGRQVAWAWGYGGQFALLAPEIGLAVAPAATSPHPRALREQTGAVMALVARLVRAAG